MMLFAHRPVRCLVGTERNSQGQVKHHAGHIWWIESFSHQFQVGHHLANGQPKLVTIDYAGKRHAGPLSRRRLTKEIIVLREHNSPKGRRAI
jgi:hypothetical protein